MNRDRLHRHRLPAAGAPDPVEEFHGVVPALAYPAIQACVAHLTQRGQAN